jgi:hypothetical protein
MNHSDIAALMKGVVPVIREYIVASVGPLIERLDAMEARVANIPVPKDVDEDAIVSRSMSAFNPKAEAIRVELEQVKSAMAGIAPDIARIALIEEKIGQAPEVGGNDLAAVKTDIESLRKAIADIPEPAELPDIPALIEAKFATIRVPEDGKPVDPADVDLMVAKHVAEAVAALPPAAKGADADPEMIKAMVIAEVAKIPPAEPGKSIDPEIVKAMVDEAVAGAGYRPTPEEIRGFVADIEKDIAAKDAALIADEVQKAVAAIEKPKDGESVTAEQLRPMVDELVSKAVSVIPVPKDGVSLAGMLIDRNGELVATLSNGETKSLGPVVGKDADMAELSRQIVEQVKAIPKPVDGIDGVGFDDLEFKFDGERTAIFKFVKGDRVREEKITLPVMIYRGVFRESEEGYKQGDVCSYGGHVWHCDTDTKDKPDGTERCWTMAMRKARDGKDAVVKSVEPPKPVKI